MSEPTPEDIENLIALFNQSDWQEMHLKTAGLEVFLSNNTNAIAPNAAVNAPVALSATTPALSADPAPTAVATSHDAPSVQVPDGMVAVLAPNLGTFYRAPKPGSPAYVEIGQTVTADSEVCLIEVMKLFTPVKAGINGVVREVRVADGAMVEYEQLLVIIEPVA